ncbi:diguanylate cyclase [Pseudomonas sp. dw_358]|uniref:diguanylate cyclase n=1 Tax=Pseudomonas sp. dw_358 TaxID=2720083 RepID=UPI001BD20965|nr:diguanylate cyclase [Pseudomonas sp. dw_358]
MLDTAPHDHPQDDPSNSQGIGRTAGVFRLTVCFIALVIVTFVAVEGWRAWRDYQDAFAQAYDSVMNLSQATAQNAEDAVRQVDVMTGALAERVEGDGLAKLDVPRIHTLMVEQAKLMPQLHGLFIYDAQGRWVVTDKSATPAGVNNADRDYFIYHRTHLDRHVRIGKVITSRSTGDLIIPVSRRLNNPDGSFAGVLLGTIKVSYFVDYYGDFKIDGKGALVLTLRTGEILARRPFTPGITDQSIAQGEIFQRYLPTSGSGVAEVQAVVDGTYRIYGYRALTSYPLIVEAGISRDSVVGPWRHGVTKTAVVLLVLIAGLVGFGFILLHQLRRRMRVENELRRAHEVMQEMALTDSLTGLGNRRKLDMLLPQEINRARRQGYAIALIMLDVDYFKRFNDRYGHSVGDDCLRRVAGAIAQTLKRPADLAIRYGGEEFTVLLPDTTSTGASLMASEILAAISALGIEHSDHPLGVVTASAGIAASLPKSDEITPAGMIKAADAFLYMAKNNGRNRWYSPMGNSALEALMESRPPA